MWTPLVSGTVTDALRLQPYHHIVTSHVVQLCGGAALSWKDEVPSPVLIMTGLLLGGAILIALAV